MSTQVYEGSRRWVCTQLCRSLKEELGLLTSSPSPTVSKSHLNAHCFPHPSAGTAPPAGDLPPAGPTSAAQAATVPWYCIRSLHASPSILAFHSLVLELSQLWGCWENTPGDVSRLLPWPGSQPVLNGYELPSSQEPRPHACS